VATIQERFNQEGFKMLCSVEHLLMNACTGDSIDDVTAVICKFFGDDFQEDDLVAQLASALQIVHHRFSVHRDC